MQVSDTQLEAFNEILKDVAAVDAEVFRCILEEPRTADEVVEIVGRVRNTIAPACTRLRGKKLIMDSGLRRDTPAGRRAIVWSASSALLQ